MAISKKQGFSNKLPNFTVRLPSELKEELDIAVAYRHAKDPSELVRGWIRSEIAKLNYDGEYQKLKAEWMAKKKEAKTQ